ncbi:MAG: hypothetical protein ACYDAP_00265 [Thermoplasmataceae archaeon]
MNLIWIKIDGVTKTEILENMGFGITIRGNVLYKGELEKNSDGSLVMADDVIAVIPGEHGKMKLVTDISELEGDAND